MPLNFSSPSTECSDIREDFFLGASFRNLDDLNAQLRHWLDTVTNPRLQPIGRSLDFAKVPKREKAEVLAAFAAHKDEVTAGSAKVGKRG